MCSEYLANCVALALPSVHECGGAVVLEAMALSRPVIATDWGGPADYITPKSGILIKPESREAMVSGFAVAMGRLLESRELCEEMGAAGRKLIEEKYDWDIKISHIVDIYREAAAVS